MKFKGYSREYTDAKMRQAAAELRNGKSVAEVCDIIGVAQDVFVEWGTVLARMAEQLTNSPVTKAVCPIFWEPRHSDCLEQIGSGVLIKLYDEVFLLTAAHVTDEGENGDLYVPGREQIVSLSGHLSYNPPLAGESRKSDKFDIAYFHLSEDLRGNLDTNFLPLDSESVNPFDRPNEKDFYTVVGYPWRKTTKGRDGIESEQVTFSGEAVSDKDYEYLGYSRDANYVIQFRRKKGFSARYQSITPSPHPEGCSGGAIFAWPKEVDDEAEVPDLKLVGICHTYHEKHHRIAGTHVGLYLWLIQHENPWMPLFRDA
jgi:hypothetical protein